MIKLSVAGGIGEHGRNCFLIRQSPFTYILDCGLSQDTFDPYPHLDSTEINQADFLIISHCHSDHAGAFLWLRQQGFQNLCYVHGLHMNCYILIMIIRYLLMRLFQG